MLVFWGPPTTGSISPQAGTQLGRVRHHWFCCDGLRELGGGEFSYDTRYIVACWCSGVL